MRTMRKDELARKYAKTYMTNIERNEKEREYT